MLDSERSAQKSYSLPIGSMQCINQSFLATWEQNLNKFCILKCKVRIRLGIQLSRLRLGVPAKRPLHPLKNLRHISDRHVATKWIAKQLRKKRGRWQKVKSESPSDCPTKIQTPTSSSSLSVKHSPASSRTLIYMKRLEQDAHLQCV